MKKKMKPLSLELLKLTPQILNVLREVKVLDIFEGSTRNFNDEGLFSSIIFGRVASAERMKSLGYIKLNAPVIHPTIYSKLLSAKQIHKDIVDEKKYVLFNKSSGEFEQSNPIEGQTGYDYFFKHLKDIELADTNSDKRDHVIKLLEQYKDNLTLDAFLVIPAGFRDYIIDEDGKPSEDEINKMYRGIITMNNLIEPGSYKVEPSSLNGARLGVQNNIGKVDLYLSQMLNGKKKFINSSWTSRNVVDGTRNVLTSAVVRTPRLDIMDYTYNHTILGLYQFIKGIGPIMRRRLKTGILKDIFQDPSIPAQLINKKTLNKESHVVEPDTYLKWMSSDGINKIINRYSRNNIRHEYIDIDGMWLALVYSDDEVFKVFRDINDLPKTYDAKKVHPITLTELLYLSIHDLEVPGLFTRHPVLSLGSTYPSYTYVVSTVKNKQLYELDDNWNITKNKAKSFPIYGEGFFNSMSPDVTRLANLGADFDGDAGDYILFQTNDSIEEIKDLLDSKLFYVSPTGELTHKPGNDIIDLVTATLTSGLM